MGTAGSDRIYCFYNKNVGVNDAREDTTGALRCRYSDDDGATWSSRTYDYPIGPAAISHPDPDVPANWIVYQSPYLTASGTVLAGFTRWASDFHDPDAGLLERDSEVWFLEFTNILTEPEPEQLRVETWPRAEHGIRIPDPNRDSRSIAQEPSVQSFSDGRLICVMRTSLGVIYYALSADGGHSWDDPRPLRYEPGGDPLLNPLTPCPLYHLADGRYLLVFYNNDGSANGGTSPIDSKKNRYPAYITVGRDIRGETDHPIRFGRPREFASSDGVLIPGTPGTQVATYPSLVDDGRTRTLFYPDRKHYLLGRHLPDPWLAPCDPGPS
jgi:hypothetical protein